MHCGSSVTAFNDFVAAVDWLEFVVEESCYTRNVRGLNGSRYVLHHPHVIPGEVKAVQDHEDYHFIRVVAIIRWHWGKLREGKPADMMRLHRQFGEDLSCSEPKDHIFALLGVHTAVGRPLPTEVDYARNNIAIGLDILAYAVRESEFDRHYVDSVCLCLGIPAHELFGARRGPDALPERTEADGQAYGTDLVHPVIDISNPIYHKDTIRPWPPLD
ncbi:hypothetical protein LTR62_006260 [Meristemomyces frigidus]|uniref:Uncharacterized protein n=1 Tax=Meristemomyces frigidus TaxID=1508187 RepID=A0AAN7TGD1_9PEZI|nr:hypothetical protein LTR62_006260 [Meristemomyces frigidus]